jgi:hypothetical protein
MENPRQSTVKGLLLKVGSWGAVLILFPILIITFGLVARALPLLRSLISFACLLCLVLAIRWARQWSRLGGRHFLIDADTLLKRDQRPPILLLRAFTEDDAMMDERKDSSGLSFEEDLVDVFGHVGPVVAIGRPGDQLPPAGAARLYVSREVWQATVSDLLARCRMVIVRAGVTTPGLAWEIRNIFTLNPFKPVLLTFADFHTRGVHGTLLEPERDHGFKEAFERETGIKLKGEMSQYLYFDRPAQPARLSDPLQVLREVDSSVYERVRKRVRQGQIVKWLLIIMAICAAPVIAQQWGQDSLGPLHLGAFAAAMTLLIFARYQCSKKRWAGVLILSMLSAIPLLFLATSGFMESSSAMALTILLFGAMLCSYFSMAIRYFNSALA